MDTLNVRNKLILFLVVPIFTILYFSISGIHSKFQEQQNARKSHDFISVSLQLDELIHELQKERGLSAGFAGSAGKLHRQELQAQRQSTDKQLKSFLQELTSKDSENERWQIPDLFKLAQQRLEELKIIRAEVDRLNKADLFDEYSSLISIGLNITQYLRVVISDASLARQSDAFTSLLVLQEHSGQERGLLNAVFTSGQMDAKILSKINGSIVAQDTLLNNYHTVAAEDQKSLLIEQMKKPEVEYVTELRAAIIHKATRNDRLNTLQRLIGYGGLIHNFKNNVIRGQQFYTDRFNKMHLDATNLISEYQELPGVSQTEIKALNTIRSTLGKYKSQIGTAKRLREEGRSITEIDSTVKVDDTPALDAISYLQKAITGLDTSDWWDKSTARIEFVRNVSDHIKSHLIIDAERNLNRATRTLYGYITLTTITLLISFILGHRIINRLIGGIIDIESHMSKMQSKGEFDNLLEVSGNDEISKVARSFNNLINLRRKHEEQLRLSAMVFHKASEAMIVTGADLKFISVNPAFTQITGYSMEDVAESTPAILKSGEHDQEFYKEMWSSLGQHGHWSGEIINRRKNGETYPEWLNINVIKNDQGEISRYIAMFSDISDRKRNEKERGNLQRQLLQAQKMESLGQLTGGIAHDFNNMLSVIIGYAELAAKLSEDNEKLDECINEVSMAGKRAKDLVAQMLAFSRGNKEVEKKLLNIKPLLEDSIKMIRPLLPSTIQFVAHFPSEAPPISANPIMIHQVIMNLCINARDSISEHGRIDFSLRSISIDKEECSSCHIPMTGEYLELSIQDSGAGIEPNIVSSLFDPFFTKKEIGNEKGTGMGLAMVHGIMHEHNGHIIVSSTLGEGANFRLLFPLAASADKVEPKQTNRIRPPKNGLSKRSQAINLLVVDDEKPIVSLMENVLDSEGFKVTGFTDSELALSHFNENPMQYDAVITDQTMPKLTGIELSKSILNTRPDIPVILCTGYSERIDEASAQTIGIKAYMNKPMDMIELASEITRLLK